MYCSWRYMVSAMMRAAGASRMIRLMACTPSTSGMTMSIRITSGRTVHASSTASAPFTASATTVKPPIRSQSWRRPWRIRVWSSAIRILAGGIVDLKGDRWQRDEQFRSLTDRTADVQLAAQVQDPLAHLAQSEMIRGAGQAGVEATTVVAQRERHAACRIHREM